MACAYGIKGHRHKALETEKKALRGKHDSETEKGRSIMFKEKRIIIAGGIFMAFIATFLFLPGLIHAGDVESIGQTKSNATWEDEDMNYRLPWWFYRFAWVEKTGQTETYFPWDDGDLQRGVAWPNPRFVDNGDGTVRDRLNTLTWMKNAGCFDIHPWETYLGVM